MENLNVAVVGATGLVGRKILEILEERNFNGKSYKVRKLDENSFNHGIDLALFAAGGSVSKKYVPIAIENGVKVVDNSSFYRMDKDVVLVVPEINKNVINKDTMLIANPNCSTIQSVLAIKAIFDNFKIKRIFNNVLPQIDVFTENGYTKEEMKMINETRKIFGDDSLKITATTARVPVENSHAISINIELEEDFDIEYIKEIISKREGVKLIDDIENEIYPLPTKATGHDDVFVGRIRRDYSVDYGINLWCVADNIRKGAATNAVENAEILLQA